jgi:DNA-binding NarL/FixJ family response regulator
MPQRREFDFAEVLVDRLFLESFANEQSPYFTNGIELSKGSGLVRFRNKLKWHINNSLSPRQKEVLRYYLSGKKEREIAQLLGITQQVVNIYKHRAIKKLQQKLVS